MAKKSQVTRTIALTKVTVLTLDVNTAEPANATYVVPRTYDSDVSLMKQLRLMYETETLKIVHIVDKVVEQRRYGMPEEEFIRLAKDITKDPTEKEE